MSSHKLQATFLRLVNAYVKHYREHSFEFIFNHSDTQVIGESKKIIKVRFIDAKEIFGSIFIEGSLGLGESYCKGLIQVDDKLYKYFIFIFVRAAYDKDLLFSLQANDIFLILRAKFKRKFFSRANTAENINAHYSLSDWFDNNKDANDFYMLWLKTEYIQYSCGKWDPDTKTLDEAQTNKLTFYAERLGIDKNSAGKTMVDLGCGWGGCMFFMAEKYGIKCHGLTLSTAQADYIKSEIKRRQLEHLVTVRIDDILNVSGTYDYAISIGVMEHVSEYDQLYRRIAEILNENGAALIHSMFHTETFYKTDPFMSKYIFPGSAMPGLKKNLKILKKYFRIVDRNDLPDNSYPKTIECWYKNFCAHEAAIRNLMEEKSKLNDIDFSIRVFKHYLTLAYCGLYKPNGLICNILVKNRL
jgi:cyclopropane-fatty-acyl-phospholipid synthase